MDVEVHVGPVGLLVDPQHVGNGTVEEPVVGPEHVDQRAGEPGPGLAAEGGEAGLVLDRRQDHAVRPARRTAPTRASPSRSTTTRAPSADSHVASARIARPCSADRATSHAGTGGANPDP